MSFAAKLRRSVVVLSAVVALGGAALAAPSPTSAQVQIPPKLVAEVVILEEPNLCHKIHHVLRIAGYWAAEKAWEIGYGRHQHPSAAKVFYWVVRECR